MSENKNFTAVFLLILLGLIWGTSFILIKQGLKVFPADQVAAMRVLSAFIFLAPTAFVRWKEVKREDVWKLFASGMMAVFIPAFLFALAQTRLNSSLAGILNTLSPVWTVLIGALFFHQKFRGWAVAGLIVSFGGSVILAMSRSGGGFGSFNAYALLIVLACAFYGMNLNFIKFKMQGYSPMTIISVSLLLIFPLAAIYLFGLTDFTATFSVNENAWKSVMFVVILGLMSTAVANLLFYKLLSISSLLFTSSVTYILPIVSVMWGLIDGEQLLAGHFIGMALILGGVFLANKK